MKCARCLAGRESVSVTDTSDGCRNALQDKGFRERDRRILRAGIAMVNQPVVDVTVGVVAPPQRHLQRRGDHRGVLDGRRMPPDDGPREAVHDERDVDEPRPRPGVSRLQRVVT
jgi:hypothetical protein